LILVQQGQGKDTIQVAQTLASFPGTPMSTQDLRSLGIKFEDLQAHIGIGGPPAQQRTIKLEDLSHLTSGQSSQVTKKNYCILVE
jgi:hypothetical protein